MELNIMKNEAKNERERYSIAHVPTSFFILLQINELSVCVMFVMCMFYSIIKGTTRMKREHNLRCFTLRIHDN